MLDEWLKAHKEAAELQEVVEDRITKIIEIFLGVHGYKLDTWYVYGAGEGEIGDLAGAIDSQEVSGLTIEVTKNGGWWAEILDKNGEEVDLSSGFPTRWLEEDLEAIKAEIVAGASLLKAKEEKERLEIEAKAKAKKTEKEIVKVEALKKLTKEERKALGL